MVTHFDQRVLGYKYVVEIIMTPIFLMGTIFKNIYYFCIEKLTGFYYMCVQLYLIKVEQPKYWGYSPLPDKTGKQVFLKQQEN